MNSIPRSLPQLAEVSVEQVCMHHAHKASIRGFHEEYIKDIKYNLLKTQAAADPDGAPGIKIIVPVLPHQHQQFLNF